jgi:predicted RNase H-like HicB family nuclease
MRDAEYFMNKNFRIALQYDPDGYWLAEHPELSGCKADGETPQEALASLDVSRKLWIESRLAAGLVVPEPEEPSQYSGRFVLRIAKSLHRELAQEAEVEGISLNGLVGQVLASRHAPRAQSVPFGPSFQQTHMQGFGLYQTPAPCKPPIAASALPFQISRQKMPGIYPGNSQGYETVPERVYHDA